MYIYIIEFQLLSRITSGKIQNMPFFSLNTGQKLKRILSSVVHNSIVSQKIITVLFILM